jgi:hypothetical protein
MKIKEYLLLLLAEECSEVAQAASKCVRFTPEHTYSGYDKSNLERLKVELSDICSVLFLLETELDTKFELTHSEEKVNTIIKYLGISREMGTLDA